MNFVNRIKNSSIFRKFLVSYLLLLFLPLLTGTIAYRISLEMIKNSSEEASLMLLNQSKMILERRMQEIEGFTRQLSMNQDLLSLLSSQTPDGSYDVYNMWKTLKSISALSYTNNFLEHFYIYLKNHDVILTPSTTFTRPQDFYDLNLYKDLDFREWKDQILLDVHHRELIPLKPMIRYSEERGVVTYVQSLPLDSFKQSQGTVVILIDEAKIRQLLEPIAEQYEGWAYITDEDGRTIGMLGIDETGIERYRNEERFDSSSARSQMVDDTFLISTRSAYYGWHYVVGIPKEVLLDKARVIQNITCRIAAYTLLAGVLMALFLSYRNIVPVHRLLGIFREHPNLAASGGKNEYDFLQGNISRLISHNKTMKEEMRRQLPLLRDAFLKRLVKGEFDSLSEAEAAMMQAGVTFPGTFGYVGMIKIIGYNGYVTQDILNELNAARLLAIQALRNNFPNSMQMTALDSDKMTFIWTDRQQPEGGAMRHLEEQLNGLKAFLESEYRISVIVSIGSPFQGLHGVAKSFNEAKHALELALFTENQWLLWYEQMTKETSGYSYPIDLEIRLMNAAKLGHFNEVQSILAEIVEKNFHERQLSAESAQQLISALKGTLYRLLEQQLFRIAQEREHFHAQLEQISGLDGLEQVHSRIETLFEQYCRLVLQRKSESHHEIIRKINEFLQAHYSDPNLSLYRLAELTGYPEKYISALYKEQTGENLSDYLEKIRIRHAMELLFRTDRTIDEIAARVGYNSAHSFRRAFKRVAGESPSIYRKSVQ